MNNHSKKYISTQSDFHKPPTGQEKLGRNQLNKTD